MARKKKDEGHEETDKILEELEKRISKEYTQAEKEISDKLNDYLRRFATKDKIKEQAWKDGKISEQDYLTWRVNQMAMGDRWQAMRDTMAKDLTNSAQMAKDITNETMPEVYAVNHNYGTYQVEKVAKVNTSYTLYDKDSVKRMFKDEDFYKGPGKKLTKDINEGKQMAWDKKQIQSVMTQSLLQGEAIGDIATRLSKTVGDSDRKAAIRNARTITTGIENAGREDSYKRAEKMGIDLMKEWIATLDDRTRHEHRMLDGMRVKVGDKFKVVGYDDIEYPGDPSADAEMVYNCRCTLVPVLKGHEVDSQDLSLRHTRNMKEQTYDEWKESKEITSHPITKQDDIAEYMKEAYNKEYRRLAGQPDYIEYYRNTSDIPSEEVSTEEMYKMADSIDEAKKYAQEVLGLDLIDYDIVNLDYANIINETITKYYSTFENLNKAGHLDEIRIVPKLSADAGYQPAFHSLLLQKKNTSSKNIVNKLAKEAREMKEIGWWSTGDQYTLIRHELGHAVQHLYLDPKAGNPYGNSVEKNNKITELRENLMKELGITEYQGMNASLEDIAKAGSKLSYYALKGNGDFIAESVAEYMSGNPRETAIKVVETLMRGD